MTRLRALAVTASLLAPLAVLAVPPAAAQGGCPGIETLVTRATVAITSPAANATVSGTVTVRGTATSSVVGSLNRVEVTFGSAQRAAALDDGEFAVAFDTTSFRPGPTPIEVVACGTLARGEASRTVNVQAPQPATTAASSGTTVASTAPGATSVPSTTVAGQPGTTSAAPTTTTPGATTTTASTPSTTSAPAEPVVAPRSTTTRGDSRADAPLVLTEADDSEDSGTPLWVGAVVGISGGLGLLFSAVSWRRRAGVPEPVEPVDPELVDVS